MNYRRVLLLTELGGDSRPALALIRRAAPGAERLTVVARVRAHVLPWLTEAAPGELRTAVSAPLEALRAAAADTAGRVDVKLTPALQTDAVAELAAALQIDLLVAGALSEAGLSVVTGLRTRCSLPVLWPAGHGPAEEAITRILCVAVAGRAERAVAAFLRDHGSATVHATVVAREARSAATLAGSLEVAGIAAGLELLRAGDAHRLGPGVYTTSTPADLLVLPRLPGALARAAIDWPAPVLALPPLPSSAPALDRRIDLPDLVDDGGVLRARIDYAAGVGRRDPIPDQQVAFVSGGRIVATVATSDGQAELPAGLDATSLGVYRVAERASADPVAVIEDEVAVIRPGSRPLLLFPSDLPDGDLGVLASLERGEAAENAPELLAVRMRATRSCRHERARLRAAGLVTPLIDASTVLDEGEAYDVAEQLDAVRLARVAERMRGAGFPVVGTVHGGPHPPRTNGIPAVRARKVAGSHWSIDAAAPPSTTTSDALAARLDATTGAPALPGNRVEIELDNAKARHWLLDAIAASRERVHLQTYMALDDDVGSQVEAALAAAGARGVNVRVLVDSLHGLHGSLGLHNRLLDRLGARPGVELHVSHPIAGMPSLEDLKQRDHRKVAIIDGAVAMVGGRNLSHEYYTGFEEVQLTPTSPWREVPWLDGGARVQGPAVAALEQMFLEAWTGAGGSAFAIAEQLASGPTGVRVVVHHGLRDAATLEAYLALIETAQSHIYAVNGFPLILEIQHALLRAIRRGVRVCHVIGHLTPRHGRKAFRGPWARARTAATEFVHSRVDALVAAGGEAYQLVVAEQPGWAGLGPLNPHVHAKIMSVDGRVCAVGSANLDITAGYWESELMLLVEDAGAARGLEARIEQLIAGSKRIDRDDPAWRRLAQRRGWMRHWPGVLSI